MSNHTPGPWTKTRLFIENKPEVFAVTDGKWKGRLIAIIGECDEQTESDASLIAAAPALLEALYTMIEDFENNGECFGTDEARIEFMKSAISQAK